MKKWSQYLEENQEVLNEFNRKDEEAVMADEENFTVAFEIEMESEGYDEDEMYEAEQEARREAAENYFGYDAEEFFRSDVYDNLTPEEIGFEEPDDGAEMIEWYYDNTSTNPSQLEMALKTHKNNYEYLRERDRKRVYDFHPDNSRNIEGYSRLIEDLVSKHIVKK